MTTPAWILDILAALMLVVAAVSAARLVTARPWVRGGAAAGPAGPDVDVAHLLMAIAMAGMLTASLTTLPNTAWDVIFALMTAWFAWRVWRDSRANSVRALAGGHCAPHLVHSAAMLYMFTALATPAGGGSGMAGMGASGGSAMQTLEYPTLAFIFALILVGYSAWDLDQLSGRRYVLAGAGVPLARAHVPAMAGAEPAGTVLTGAAGTGDSATASAESAAGPLPVGSRGRGPGVRALLLSPGTTVGCRIVMGITMAFMLVIMI
jgi:Domain of unknown function (DUF5134)